MAIPITVARRCCTVRKCESERQAQWLQVTYSVGRTRILPPGGRHRSGLHVLGWLGVGVDLLHRGLALPGLLHSVGIHGL
jgi:hypothetical protein